MRALVTNDDGIDSVGIRVLADAAVRAGLDVVAAAPDSEYSGSSAAMSALEEDGRLLVADRRWEDVSVERAVGVRASPAFTVVNAALGAFGDRPELVLSGINHGPNTGQAVLHSGTVGAALTATTFGIPGLAVSMAAMEPKHWDTAAEVTHRVLRWLLGRELRGVLNLNVPDVPLEELQGIAQAPLATFGAVQGEVTESGEGYVTMTFSFGNPAQESGTDSALLADGWATVTVVQAPCVDTSVDLSALVSDT